MALDAEVGTFTGDGVTTGADNVPFTNGSLAAKLFLPYGNHKTGASDDLRMSFGAATGAIEQGAIFIAAQDNQTTMRTRDGIQTALTYQVRSDNPATSDLVNFDTTALNTGSVDIDINSAAFSSRFQYLALGGSDIDVEVVNFALNTSTGNQDVNLTRLTGSTVKAVLLFATERTTTGTGTGGVLSYGMTDGTTQACATMADEHGAADSDTYSAHRTDCLLSILDMTGAVIAEADIVSLGTGTFRLNLTTAAAAHLVMAVVICGSVSCQVKNFSMPGSVTTQALGFTSTPNVLIQMSGAKAAGAASAQLRGSFGCAASTSQLSCIAGASQDAQPSSNNSVYTSTAKIIAFCNPTGGTMLAEADLNDMQTLDWTTEDGIARDFSILAISAASGGTLNTVSQTDGLFLRDFDTRQTQKITQEGTFLLDTALPQAVRTLLASDGLFLTDSYFKTVSRLLVDGLFLDEASIRQTERILADTLLFYEESTQAKGKFVTAVDGLLLADTVSKVVQLRLNDTLFLFDSVSTSAAQVYLITATDTLLLLDATTKILEATRPDSVLLADLVTKQVQRLVDDALFLLDIRTASTSLLARETVLFSDQIGTAAERYRSFEDQILLHDRHSKLVQKVTQDGLLLLDEVRKVRTLLHRDDLFLVDQATTVVIGVLNQALVYARLATRSFLGIEVNVSAWPFIQTNVADFLNVEVGVVDPNNQT